MSMYCNARSLPLTDTLVRIAQTLGVSIEYLALGGEPGLEPYEDDVKRIAVAAKELELQERQALSNLTFALGKGDEQVRDLIRNFAEIAQRLTANTNLQKQRIINTKFEEYTGRVRKKGSLMKGK